MLHGLQAVLGNQDPRNLLHGLQAVWEERTAQLHGLQAVLGRRKTPRDHLQRHGAGAVHEDDPGSERTLGNRRRMRFPARRHTKRVREPGTWTYDRLRLPLLLLPGCATPSVCSARRASAARSIGSRSAATKEICCTKWVCEPRTKTCCYKVCHMVPERRPAATRSARWCLSNVPHVLLQGLPHGAGSSGPAATRFATWCPSNSRTCCYKVCHMVPEQRRPAATRSATWCPSNARTCCYKVCHMVPEQRDLLLQGLPHGA